SVHSVAPSAASRALRSCSDAGSTSTLALAYVAASAQVPAPAPAPTAGAPATAPAKAPARGKAAGTPADARMCLEFPTNAQVIACAEKYRHMKAPA
ncbi:MAG: hypothetical protein ACM3OA_02145, partial [Acidobacteriota bacterium]